MLWKRSRLVVWRVRVVFKGFENMENHKGMIDKVKEIRKTWIKILKEPDKKSSQNHTMEVKGLSLVGSPVLFVGNSSTCIVGICKPEEVISYFLIKWNEERVWTRKVVN